MQTGVTDLPAWADFTFESGVSFSDGSTFSIFFFMVF
jgi:hypothetical protein